MSGKHKLFFLLKFVDFCSLKNGKKQYKIFSSEFQMLMLQLSFVVTFVLSKFKVHFKNFF